MPIRDICSRLDSIGEIQGMVNLQVNECSMMI